MSRLQNPPRGAVLVDLRLNLMSYRCQSAGACCRSLAHILGGPGFKAETKCWSGACGRISQTGGTPGFKRASTRARSAFPKFISLASCRARRFYIYFGTAGGIELFISYPTGIRISRSVSLMLSIGKY